MAHHHHGMLPGSGDFLLLFVASVLGSAHCVGMCGPYVAMCSAQFVPRGATPAVRLVLRLCFNFGRIATYSVIGLIVGAFGQIALAAAARVGLSGLIAIVAGIGALTCGLTLIGWLRDPARLVAYVGIDRLIRAARARLSHSSPLLAPLFLGTLQGWLPCALVYAAASRAAVAGSAGMGALTMLIFGLGTVPTVFSLTMVPRTVLRRFKAQRIAGVLLATLGGILILRGLAGLGLISETMLW